MKSNVLIRLALVDTIGFSASTIMPLWLGRIADHFHMPASFAGAAVLAQLGGAALLNLLTPVLFSRIPPLRLARSALVLSAGAYLVAITSSPAIFIVACLVCGSSLGVVLNITNRMMGSTEHVQKSYAIFVLIGVFAATAEFLGGAFLIEKFGLLAVFPLVSFAAVIGLLLLIRLPVTFSTPAQTDHRIGPTGRSYAILGLAAFALFFIGQSAINALMPIFGQAAGLDANAANKVVGLGLPFGFIGALLSRFVGERVRPIVSVIGAVAVLACVAVIVSTAPSLPTFVAVVIIVSLSTLFVVPYFFAHLGHLDRTGRYAAFGPAMMLTGIAAGPSTAVLIQSSYGLRTVGIFSAVLLILGGVVFAASTRNRDVVTRTAFT